MLVSDEVRTIVQQMWEGREFFSYPARIVTGTFVPGSAVVAQKGLRFKVESGASVYWPMKQEVAQRVVAEQHIW